MAEMKFSRQREAIKSFLKTRKDHPTAETVYKNVRKEYPNISLGTVYRNLTLLSEKREINKLTFNDGADHFDADTSRHYHFICTRCKAVMDLLAKVVRDEALLAKVREAAPQIMAMYDQNGWEMGLFYLADGHAEIRGMMDLIEEFDV